MSKIKTYEDFCNEEFNQDTVDLIVKLGGISVILSSVFAGYKVFTVNSERQEEINKQISQNVRKDKYLKQIIIKIMNNEDFNSMLDDYKDTFDNLSYDEMQIFRSNVRKKLGSILTEEEYEYVDDTITEIVKNLKSKTKSKFLLESTLTEEETEILHRYGFTEIVTSSNYTPCRKNSWSCPQDGTSLKNEKIGVEIAKDIDSNQEVFYYIKEDPEYTKMKGFKRFLRDTSTTPTFVVSEYYTDLIKCINDSIYDKTSNK